MDELPSLLKRVVNVRRCAVPRRGISGSHWRPQSESVWRSADELIATAERLKIATFTELVEARCGTASCVP